MYLILKPLFNSVAVSMNNYIHNLEESVPFLDYTNLNCPVISNSYLIIQHTIQSMLINKYKKLQI